MDDESGVLAAHLKDFGGAQDRNELLDRLWMHVGQRFRLLGSTLPFSPRLRQFTSVGGRSDILHTEIRTISTGQSVDTV